MWQYYAFRIAGLLARLSPKQVSYFVARLVAEAAYLACRNYRRNVTDNIRHVLGAEADRHTVRQTTHAVFRNWARSNAEFIRLPQLKFKNLDKDVTINGWQHMEEALSRGKGVILATAHLGNFDIGAQIMIMRSVKMNAIVEPLQPDKLFRHICSLRGSNGLTLMPATPDGVAESLRALERGEVVGMVCERDIQGRSMRMRFFDEETTFPVGPITLALRAGATVLPAFCVRGSRGGFELHCEPPLVLNTGNRHQSVRPSLEKLIAVIESYIRRYPEQWVVLQPIWRRNHAPDKRATQDTVEPSEG